MELLGGRRLDYRPPRPPQPPREARVGVGGFLLFTCIFMVFINPGLFLYYNRELIVKLDFAHANLFTALQLAQDVVIIAFGVVAGILLWKGKRAGLLLARTFFIVRGGIALLGMAAFSLLYFSRQYSLSDSEYRSLMTGYVMGVALTAGFIAYLFLSARVKATYPKPAPEGEEPLATDQT